MQTTSSASSISRLILTIVQALCGSDALNLVAVVTTVNNGKLRAGLARQWLRVLAIPDDQVPILPYSDCNSAACQLPLGFDSGEDAGGLCVGEESDTPRALLQLICKCVLPPESAPFTRIMCACRYGPRLVIIAIAPLTPLAAAMNLDENDARLGVVRLVARVYMQGQVLIAHDDTATPATPSDRSYNFRIDMGAARLVFEQLQLLKRPVSMLGKYAAYQISFTKQDLESLDGPRVPSLAIAARDQMQAFKQQNPDLFYSLFPVPEQFRDGCGESVYEWFDHLPGDVVSHPYDALLALMAEEDASPFASGLFARVTLSDFVEAVGNDEPPSPHGVVDPQAVKNAIMTLMRRAIQRSAVDIDS
jgi:hypothetical protein